MVTPSNTAFIITAKEQCRVCYTCVRECPAKAIRITDGQAEVIPERCIACGNCVRVCSQNAKRVISSVGECHALINAPAQVAAIVAPSFPADFNDMHYQRFVGMVRELGFDYVHEVAFGADLVAEEYRRLLETSDPSKRFISTACPGVIKYVEKYAPDLVDALAPVVSPMIAQARIVRKLHGPDTKVIFIGPCIAKKSEAESHHVPDEVNVVLTFVELRQMFAERGLTPDKVADRDFDPPHANLGALFPLSRGLLQAAEVAEDLLAGEVVATDGNKELVEAVREFASGALDARFLDILCCNGCIMGAGMSQDAPLFGRRSQVSQYVRQRMQSFDRKKWLADMYQFRNLNLRREFTKNDQRLRMPDKKEIAAVLARMGKQSPEDELNCGACGYETCVEHAVAILKGFAESEMCLPNTIGELRTTVQELAVSHEQLANAQEALVQSEKLASMGQLAAGIAHEVNNPLGVVLMYAHLLLEEASDKPELAEDLKMVVEQADRCKKIVAGLLHFARQNKVSAQPSDLLELVRRIANVVHMPDNIRCEVTAETDDSVAEIDPDQISQVVTNLVTNAVAAMTHGGELNLTVAGDDDSIRLLVCDTGTGITPENMNKIFEPFFTTKQMGKGTGLGLAVTYGIVKMHRGDIKVESNADPAAGATGTTFTVTLPRKRKEALTGN